MALMKFVSSVVPFLLFCLDTSMTYSEFTIENDNNCAQLLKKRKFTLRRSGQSGIIVKDTHYFNNWSGQYEFECNFVVKSDHGDGVIAVIQQLSFREANEDSTSEEGRDQCLDFVEFKGNDGTKSIKYCGKISAFSTLVEDESSGGGGSDRKGESNEMLEVSQNAFYDPGGELEVKIYIKNKFLYPFEKIDVVIAFTSYVGCHKRIDDYLPCGTDMCIWYGFFNDGVVNCPFSNCLDESGSCRSPVVSKRGLSSKVTVGAIATIFLSFLFFFVCLWLVRRHGLLCWSRDCSGRQPPESRVEMRSQHATVHVGSDDEGAAPLPSAPSEEKDLPPTYNSLFPNK